MYNVFTLFCMDLESENKHIIIIIIIIIKGISEVDIDPCVICMVLIVVGW